MDVLMQQRQIQKRGNNIRDSFVHTTQRVGTGALREVREGTGVALHALEYAIEQPVTIVKGLGNEIKTAVVDAKNTMVHMAILGMFGYFAYEFMVSEQVMARTGRWVNGLVSSPAKRQRIY